ncbi:MAG: long-chain fatty acid--CoA ligase [Nitrospinota bacterium]
MNMATFLERAADSFGERPAVFLGARVYCTYAELAGRVARLGGRLRDRLGIAPGDRVAITMRNCPEFVEVLYGIWHAGLCAVPINAKLHPREFEFILENSGAKCCFATPGLMEAVGPLQDSVSGLERVVEIDSEDHRTLLQGDPASLQEREPDDLAWLFYTSGTTGRPKGAMLSHRNLQAMTLSYFADIEYVLQDDNLLHAAPMSHGSGLYIMTHVAKAAGQIVPESGGFDPEEIYSLIAAHKGVSFFIPPTMVMRLVNSPAAEQADTRNLKTLVYGGGPMYVQDLKKAMALLGNKLTQAYGQGETPMTATTLSKELHADTDHPRYEERIASVGIPHSVVEVRVADSEDRPLPPGEIGEVLVRGETVMQGYLNNPQATESSLRGGWLHTGDVGSFDEDGFLTLKDRSKDLIISGGANIYPREVEEVLLKHNGVLEVSVVGREHPEWGEEVVAFVVPKPGSTVTEGELDTLCLDNIARYKRPRTYRFIDALPKNNYGKVLKTELREQLHQESGGDGGQ